MRAVVLLFAVGCTAVSPTTDEVVDTDPDETADTTEDVGDTGPAGVDSGDSAAPDTAPPPVSLYGADVRMSVHCCTQPPSADNQVDAPLLATVGGEVEFLQITDPWATLNADVDLEEHGLIIGYLETESALSRDFNGYVFRFSNGSFSRITDVRYDAARSTVPARQIRWNHTDDEVWVDISGLAVTPASVIALEIDAR